MTTPRRHHYIPRFYLAGFVDPAEPESQRGNGLWVYERSKPIRKSTPENEAHQRDFYAYQEAGEKKYEMEEFLSTIESHIAPILLKVEDPDYVLSKAEKLEMAAFVALMFTRVPAGRELTDRLSAQLAKALVQRNAEDEKRFYDDFAAIQRQTGGADVPAAEMRKLILEGNWDVEQKSPEFNLAMMIDMTEELVPVLYGFGWQIWHANSYQLFLTSDNPVISSFPGPGWMKFGMGFGIEGVEVVFPLSSRACLWMKRGEPEGSTIVSERAVRDVNKRVIMCARRFLYSPERSGKVAHLFERIGGQVEYGENAFLPPVSPEFPEGSSNL